MKTPQMVFILAVLFAPACDAAESIEIVKSEGVVTMGRAAGGLQQAVHANVFSTGNGRAVVRVGAAGYIVLERNSTVEINNSNEKAGFFRHLGGIIYYALNTLKGKDKKLEVRLRTITAGIRGTRFLVEDTSERSEIGMRKGVLSVSSLGADFEIHKQKDMDEFEAFKQAGQDAVNKSEADFEAYKQSTQQEFIEYKHEFSLGADRMAIFDGKRVDDRPLSGAAKKDMESLESYAGEWIDKVQD